MTFSKYIEILITGVPHILYVIALLTFCIGVGLLLGFYKRRRGWSYCMALLLLEYVSLVYCSTVFFRRALKVRAFDFTPFWSYNKPGLLVENVMNVVIFVPIGVLFGFMVNGSGLTVRKGWMVSLLVGLSLSVGIETMQFVMKRGFSEVDDVMHNTLGCLIGYGIYLVTVRMWRLSADNACFF